MRPDQVALIAKRLGVPEQDVIDMNRRLGGHASLNAPIREDGDESGEEPRGGDGIAAHPAGAGGALNLVGGSS